MKLLRGKRWKPVIRRRFIYCSLAKGVGSSGQPLCLASDDRSAGPELVLVSTWVRFAGQNLEEGSVLAHVIASGPYRGLD